MMSMEGFAPLCIFLVFTWVTLLFSVLIARHFMKKAEGMRLFQKSVNASYWGAYNGSAQIDGKGAIKLPETFAVDHTVFGSKAYSKGGF
ncbi:MAG: hypothetical protein AB7W16_28550 [Candidatus Obscuribacterales bacterium]